MAKWQISKDFFCDYGHRVWTQELQDQFCAVGDTSCKCKHLHGHTGKVTVEVGANHLERGFVTDFKHLGFMKNYVDEYFDHRFIIDIKDPIFKTMTEDFNETHKLETVAYNVKRFMPRRASPSDIGFFALHDEGMDEEQKEYIESFTVVNFVPTSENLAKHVFNYARSVLGDEAEMISVTWQETPKSKATYYG